MTCESTNELYQDSSSHVVWLCHLSYNLKSVTTPYELNKAKTPLGFEDPFGILDMLTFVFHLDFVQLRSTSSKYSVDRHQ